MKFSSRITLKDYRQLSTQLLLQNKAVKFLRYFAYILGFCFLISLITFFENPAVAVELLTPVIYLPIIIGLIIIAYRYNIKKTFLSNKLFSADIDFEINNDYFSMAGNDFKMEKSIASMYKITELKDWFLLYESTAITNFIPKKNLSPSQLAELKQLLLNAVGPQKIKLSK